MNQTLNVISKERIKEITSRFSDQKKIMVIGDVGVDKYTFGQVKRISPEAPVPVLEVSKEWTKLGLAANISDNLNTLGIRSLLCGVIGQDNHGSLMETLLEDRDLSTWGLVHDESRPTIYKERVTTETQQICRIDYEDSSPLSDELSSKLIERVKEFFHENESIIIEDYSKGTLSESVIQEVIKLAKENKKIVTIDPGVKTSPLFYRGASLLKPNLKEAHIMIEALGKKSGEVSEMLKVLLEELELESVVITLGGEGMGMLERGGEVKMIPTVANEVFDVSGAGDTAIALLTSSLMCGASLEEAAWISNCGSGVVVGKKGTATVSLKELLDFHATILKKVKG